MNVTINFKDTSGEMDVKTEATAGEIGFVPDAGAPPADIGPLSNVPLDPVNDVDASDVEDVDIGGPVKWLVQAMAAAATDGNDPSNDTVTDDIKDGGAGSPE